MTTAVAEYIDKWQLHESINDAVSEVLEEMPGNPYFALAQKFLGLVPKECQESIPAISSNIPLVGLVRSATQRLTDTRSEEVSKLPEADIRVLADTCSNVLSSKRVLRGFFTNHSSSDETPKIKRKRASTSAVDPESLDPEFLEKLLRIALELASNVTQEDELLKIIIECTQELLSADRCSLFVRQGDELVTQIKEDEVIRVHIGTGLVGHCAKTGDTINLSNAYDDDRFNRTVDEQTGYKTGSLLCAPIVCDREVVAVAQLLNKKDESGTIAPFTQADLNLFKTYAAFAGLAIHNAELYMEQAALMQKNQFFISVIQKLSQVDMRNWGQVVGDVSEGAREVLQAERCTLFVVDKELNELRAHGEAGEIRFAAWKGVAGHVYSTGETLNITHPYSDRRFNPDVDKQTGLITHSLLTMPVKHQNEVIAVVQVVNKKDKGGFTSEDEETLRYFAHFAGVTLNNCNLYEFVLESRNKAMELFEKQLQVLGTPLTPRAAKATFSLEAGEVEAILSIKLEKEELELVKTSKFNAHNYTKGTKGKSVEYDKLILLCVHLFEELNILRNFNLSREKLIRFVCAVRRKYRNVPYHSFIHAFDVTQTLFTYLVDGKCQDFLTELDTFVLMVSALLHDVDHMGLNNSFHFKTESPLGILSSASGSSSVLEVHHCHISLQLLEMNAFNVFDGVNKEQSHGAYRGLISNILATDMAKHQDLLERFSAVCEQGYRKEDSEHRRLASNMLLKAADISNISKPFEISRRWGLAITEEFHIQGDVEKNHGHTPAPMFDRSMTHELAKGQTGFIDHVGLDLFSLLQSKLFKHLSWPLTELRNNRVEWFVILEKTHDLHKRRASKGE